MKRGLLALLAAMGFFIVSCSTTTDPVQSESQLKDNGSTQSADVTHDEWEQPISWWDECADQLLEGNVRVKTSMTHKEMPDGRMLMRFTYNVSGVLYDGDGDKYIWRDNTFYSDEYASGECPIVSTGHGTVRLMTAGKKNNPVLNFDYKYNIDCDWNFDVEYDNWVVTCK